MMYSNQKMRWSRKGAKDNSIRLVWSKYFKYTVENQEYFFKEKAYSTYNDAWIKSETIKEQTYKNAIKRGNECIEIDVEEDVLVSSKEHLTIIFAERYKLPKNQIRKCIYKANIAIEQIRKHSTMNAAIEYKIFKGILECYIDLSKKEIENDMSKM